MANPAHELVTSVMGTAIPATRKEFSKNFPMGTNSQIRLKFLRDSFVGSGHKFWGRGVPGGIKAANTIHIIGKRNTKTSSIRRPPIRKFLRIED